jgi:hypothetical protein
LWGYVRFSLAPLPDALQANDLPLPLTVRAGDAACDSDTVATGPERYIAYTCVVPRGTAAEVATLQLVPRGWGWADDNGGGFRACRYAALPPAAVNFLVIRGDVTCPRAVPPQPPHNGDPVVTVQHQP